MSFEIVEINGKMYLLVKDPDREKLLSEILIVLANIVERLENKE